MVGASRGGRSGRAPTGVGGHGCPLGTAWAWADFSKTDPATVPTVLPMTSTTPMTRTAIFHARPGHGGRLAARLLHRASPVAEAPGGARGLVHREGEDPDTVQVSEMGASHTQCVAALD